MLAGAVKHPYRISALAGATIFFWVGVLEAFSLLFFHGAMIKIAGMADWTRMLASLDTGLLLIGGFLYGTIGLALGMLWWAVISRLSSWARKPLKRMPREAADFFELFCTETKNGDGRQANIVEFVCQQIQRIVYQFIHISFVRNALLLPFLACALKHILEFFAIPGTEQHTSTW